jgi:RHS repeat-associated protein
MHNGHSGLYEFYARTYDPATGTWLQQDVYRGEIMDPMSLHRYGYVGNSPVNFRDWYGYNTGCTDALCEILTESAGHGINSEDIYLGIVVDDTCKSDPSKCTELINEIYMSEEHAYLESVERIDPKLASEMAQEADDTFRPAALMCATMVPGYGDALDMALAEEEIRNGNSNLFTYAAFLPIVSTKTDDVIGGIFGRLFRKSDEGSGIVNKGDDVIESSIPDYITGNRSPIWTETILNSDEFVKTGKRWGNGENIFKKDGKYFYIDNFHTGKGSHIEVFDKNGHHLGEMDPISGNIDYSNADNTKILDKSYR